METLGGKPSSSSNCSFELFELILLSKVNTQFSIEQFEPTVSQSKVPSPPLTGGAIYLYTYIYIYVYRYIRYYIYMYI